MIRTALVRRVVTATSIALLLSACSVDAPSSVAPSDTAAAGSSSATSGSASESTGGSEAGLEWTAIDFGCDFIGDVEARGRVTNATSSGIASAAFTITVLQDDRIAATLTGFVSDLDVGASKTVEFISTDDCLEGEYTFDIQTDFSFGGGSSSGGSSVGSDESSGSLEWSLIDFGCDFIGDIEARGRVENMGTRPIASAAFTITVFQGGRIAATLTGFVDSLGAGATKTVEFISTDDCLEGDFEYDVQTDFAFEG
jgi:hypothetical protein